MHNWRQHLQINGPLQHCACVGKGSIKPKDSVRPSAGLKLLLYHWKGARRGEVCFVKVDGAMQVLRAGQDPGVICYRRLHALPYPQVPTIKYSSSSRGSGSACRWRSIASQQGRQG